MDEQPKNIRFITSDYHFLFSVPDGGNVVVNHFMDGRLVLPCKYVGETHAQIGNYLYHICEFAEKMERAGNTYEPEQPEKMGSYEIVKRIDFDNHRGIALGYSPTAPEPYVTWKFHERYDQRNYADGKYRKRLSSALADFERRAEPYTTGPYAREVKFQFDKTAGLPRQRATKEGERKCQNSKSNETPSR